MLGSLVRQSAAFNAENGCSSQPPTANQNRNMKYFIDTEFIESFHKPLFGKRRHFIDLISIGIVAEDGREYYAISSEYEYKDADDWVKYNVIFPLYKSSVHGDMRSAMHAANFNKKIGKKNSQIAQEIVDFVNPECLEQLRAGLWPDMNEVSFHTPNKYGYAQPEFYAYYADYDWVLFCSLFGRMIDLPSGFPMYCRDLKQMMDEKGLDGNWKEFHCPDPKKAHNALEDARWNKNLYYEIIKTEAK